MKKIKIKFVPFFAALIILILHQTPSALSSRDVVQLFEAVGDSAGSKLGYKVVGLRDQNGDGYDDILTSALGDRKAFIYFGGNPMNTVPDVIFHEENEERYGGGLCNLGDVNGDYFVDFAIASNELVRIYWGGAELDTFSDWILPSGTSLCAAGDVNGDGYSDILISDVNWQSSRGKVALYLGGEEPDSIADWTAKGDSARYYFGAHITGNGDINGDGYDDIAISGWYHGEHRDYPYIKIFYGGAELDTIPAFVMDSLEDSLDISLEAAFVDVNGDDFSDLCADSGVDTSAVLFNGPILPDIIPNLVLQGTYLSGKMWEISEAGDINNDGYSDIITGNYDGWNNLGEVLLFLGGPYMDEEFDIGFTGFMHSYEGAGRSVGKAGDVNGDSVDDILFGAWAEYGFNREGMVLVFSGDTTLTSISSDSPRESEPRSFCLRQNYPNPFNKSTVIEYQISVTRPTRSVLKIYNILGEGVVTLVDEQLDSGFYQVSWDGQDKSGTDVGTGVYLYLLQVGNYRQARKLLLMR